MTKPIGTIIRERRVAKGISLTKLAAQVGTSPSHISMIERNKTKPLWSTVERIAAVLGEDIVRASSGKKSAKKGA